MPTSTVPAVRPTPLKTSMSTRGAGDRPVVTRQPTRDSVTRACSPGGGSIAHNAEIVRSVFLVVAEHLRAGRRGSEELLVRSLAAQPGLVLDRRRGLIRLVNCEGQSVSEWMVPSGVREALSL
jgi:hypothetical protein